MEKKGNKLIGLFDAQAQVLIQVGELRAAGYEEEELYLVSKHDEQINLLIEHTGVHVDTQDRDNFKGKVIAFLAGEDITKDAFNRMGLEAEETDHYFRQVENGKLLLYTDSEPAAAPRPDAALPPGRENDSLAQDAEEQRLALHEEQLSINKEKVQTGEVQVQKKMVEEDREVQVPVEREEIVIDRLPLSAETDAEKDDQVLTPKQAYEKGEAIYIPLSEERLDIGKKKVVREEIVIGKRKVKDVQVINQTVRREVADIEENGTVHKTNKP
ncbi:YsnF/AvaK domain-containing protein [Planococcus soli]|uniref:YsnF/AvaK domain-containing protein n=1 Tax=Planococcus soli TaxID=2666072 RepID=UPI00115CC1FE|nr:YsnF/AvaK domain-containing protein [Planococcus soli]